MNFAFGASAAAGLSAVMGFLRCRLDTTTRRDAPSSAAHGRFAPSLLKPKPFWNYLFGRR
jgi:hypothetical protein